MSDNVNRVSWLEFVDTIWDLCRHCKHIVPSKCNLDCLEKCFAGFCWLKKPEGTEQ